MFVFHSLCSASDHLGHMRGHHGSLLPCSGLHVANVQLHIHRRLFGKRVDRERGEKAEEGGEWSFLKGRQSLQGAPT